MDFEVICVDDEDDEIFSQEVQEPQPPASEVVDLTTEPSEPASFDQEYDVLRSAAQGFEPPLEAIAELLLRHPQHWWCRYPDAMAEMLPTLADGSGSAAGSSETATATHDGDDDGSSSNATGVGIVWRTASVQLTTCKRCLVGYHSAQDPVFARLLADAEEGRPTGTGERFRAAVLAQDRARLQRSFRSADGMSAAGGAPAASTAVGVEVAHAFWEVLSYSRLLEEGGIEAAFLGALAKVISSGTEAFAGEEWDNQHLPGVYALLVHRDASTRGWAQSMARRAGRVRSEEYLEVLSPVVDRWVPVLEQGLSVASETSPPPSAAGSEYVEKERLHWSGLHAALQLLEPSAASLLAYGFPSLVDLTLHKFDDGPECRGVPVYLQVCGCLAALLRLLGTGVWEYSSREPSEVLEAFQRQSRHSGHAAASVGFPSGSGATARAQSRCPPNEAVHKKVVEMLPMLVASAPAAAGKGSPPCGGVGGRVQFGGGGGDALSGSWGSAEARRVGAGAVAPVAWTTPTVGSSLPSSSFSATSLAEAALGFLSTEIASLSAGDHAAADQGTISRRRMALTRALLGVLETCYGGSVGTNGGNDPLDPEGWPWNAAAAAPNGGGRWWYPSWPVHSLASWGPRLADIAGDRRSGGGGGGGGAAVVDRAARAIELVLRQHAGAAWREALSALRLPAPLSGGTAGGRGGAKGEGAEKAAAVLPLCGPLLERICLELPLIDLPVRVHAAVFAAHGWLSLLPCGDSAIRAAEGGGGGARGAGSLGRLHSGVLGQFLKLFVPYVEGLTKMVKLRGASVSPVLLPQVAPFIFQALLAAVPAARLAIQELLSCSLVETRGLGGGAPASKKGDLRPLLRRLPPECSRACFLAIPQALGAMAAAGPHLCLKSWGSLFQAVGVLGCAVLLPPAQDRVLRPSGTSRSGGGRAGGGGGAAGSGGGQRLTEGAMEEAEGDGGGGSGGEEEEAGQGDEDGELWEALGAVWEFVFLQVLPEALPALREQHASRLEEALRPLFGSLESLWPLLTGPVPHQRRPRLADDFYSSRSLWLRPLLAWVSEPWLPVPAREAAAGFVKRALLPFLHAPPPPPSSKALFSPSSTLSLLVRSSDDVAGISSGGGGGGEGGSRAKAKKKVRLVGGRLQAVEEEDDEEDEAAGVYPGVGGGAGGVGGVGEVGRDSSEVDEERKVLLELRSASAALAGVSAAPTAQGQPLPSTGDRDGLDPTAPANPFAHPAVAAAADRAAGGSSGAGDGSGWSQTPWERRVGVGNSAARSGPAGGGARPEPSLDQFDFARVSSAAAPSRRPSTVVGASRGNRRSAAEQEVVSGPSAVARAGRGLGGLRPGLGVAAGAAAAAAIDRERSSGERFVTAAEAAARSPRVQASATVAAAARPRGSVVERWREMQRKQMEKAGKGPASARSRNNSQQHQQQQQQQQMDDQRAQTPTRGDTATGTATTAASNSAEAKAAFAAAAQAAAGRADGAPDRGARTSHGRPAAAAAVLDPAALAEASSMELHRLVLSSWTVAELLAASSSQRQGRGGSGSGGGFQGSDYHARDRRLLSSLWLSKVPTRFQSAEQYLDIFRGLLLEEIFATLVAALRGSVDGRERGNGSGGSETLRVAAFVESGNGGFSHVTLVAGDGGGGGGPTDRGEGPPRFGHHDVLLLSLEKKASVAGDTVNGSPAVSCLGIFEKEPRGSAKVFLRQPAATANTGQSRDRSGGSARTSEGGLGIIPKKKMKAVAADLSEWDGEEPDEAHNAMGAMLRAFREPGTQVRVVRLEGLSTSTREFAAIEAVGGTHLLHPLLQATSDPKLLPLPARLGNTNPPHAGRTTTRGPPYPVDEASFTDACKRLASVEDSFSRAPGGGGGRRSGLGDGRLEGSGGDSAVDAAAPAELLLRSLGSLASFRVTAELLTSHGRGTAKRLKGLSKSEPWGPVVRGAAARLFRAWRATVNDGGSGASATPEPGESVTRDEDRAGGKGKDSARVAAAATTTTSERDAETRPHEERSGSRDAGAGNETRSGKDESCEAPLSSSSDVRAVAVASHTSPERDRAAQPTTTTTAMIPPKPKRPSLVPTALWDRLSQEFNTSQLTAIWAAAASQLEARQERASAAAGKEAATAQPAPRVEAAGNRTVGGGIVLLQGPPGTGKTRTILGVVSAILARREEKGAAGMGASDSDGGVGGGEKGMGTTLEVGARQKRPGVAGRWAAAKTHQRVLVCAPSNGAVDELTQRLALETGGVWDHRGKAVAPRVVRIGRPSEDSAPRVRAVSLEVMVEERVKLHAKSTEARNAEKRIRDAYEQINEAGRALRSAATGEDAANGVSGIGSAENRRHQLNTQIRRLRGDVLVAKQRRRDALRGLEVERGRIRRSLVTNAQVVCSTLSGCGSAPLVEAVSLSRKGFDTVIVDEACQATEPSTMIPLSLGCKRLILVGDPRQLPATVISQRAARLKLEVSLFERLEHAGFPLHMLTVQYRMHPEIRAFPSARFYGGRLTDAPCVRQPVTIATSPPSPSPSSSSLGTPGSLGPCFPPFLVVDVTSGLERRVGSSYQNQREASFVATFVDRLAAAASGSRQGRGAQAVDGRGGGPVRGGGGVFRVGVITPYRGQVQCIRQELGSSRRADDGGVDVEVSTVDGFQGKEVDVVLFSCVRAPSSAAGAHGRGNGGGGGGIGFLADQRRMNVAITRAKLSLVVLGNARRLSADANWRALVEHAVSLERVIESRAGDGGEEICARLEARVAAATPAPAPAPAARRSREAGDGHRGLKRSSTDVDSTLDGGNGGVVANGDEPQPTREHLEAPRGRRGSAPPPGPRPEEGEGPSKRILSKRSRDGDRTDRRQAAADGVDGAGRHRKPARRSAAEGEARSALARGGVEDVGRERSTRDWPAASTTARSAVAESKRWVGGPDRRQKRPRMASPESARGGTGGNGGSSSGGGGGGGGGGVRGKGASPRGSASTSPTPANEGFLAGLLGSLTSNADGIASGKEHAFRQGLRGGEDDARKRAAAAPRLGGARVTELSRPRQPRQAPPPAAFATGPPRSRQQAAGRGTTATTSAASRKSSGGHGGGGENRERPAGQAQQRGGAHGSGSGSGGGTKLPARRGAGGRAGGGGGGKAGGASGGGSGSRGGSGVAGMGVMDILKAMDDSWGGGSKKK